MEHPRHCVNGNTMVDTQGGRKASGYEDKTSEGFET